MNAALDLTLDRMNTAYRAERARVDEVEAHPFMARLRGIGNRRPVHGGMIGGMEVFLGFTDPDKCKARAAAKIMEARKCRLFLESQGRKPTNGPHKLLALAADWRRMVG